MISPFALLLLPMVFCGYAVAQDAGNAAPQNNASIRRLRAITEKNFVLLSWQDNPDMPGPYVVYRSLEPFSAATLAKAQKLGEIAAGVGTYTDSPPPGVGWYYLVLVLDAEGIPQIVFEPMQTMTAIAISVEASDFAAAPTPIAPAATPPIAAEPAAVEPPIVPPKPEVPSVPPPVAASPPKQSEMREDAEVKAALAPSPAKTETPTAPTAPLVAKYLSPPPPLPPKFDIQERTAPLPYFVFGSLEGKATTMPPSSIADSELDPTISKAAAILLSKASVAEMSVPEIKLLEDPKEKASTLSGDLPSIAKAMIANRDWPWAITALNAFLESERSPTEVACARYYLGINLIESGKPEDGLYELLQARDKYPIETRFWIDYAIRIINSRR